MQTTPSSKKRARKVVFEPQRPQNSQPTDRGTLIAFYVMMGALAAGMLYFIVLLFAI